MRREDLQRLRAWDVPLPLQRAVGDEPVDAAAPLGDRPDLDEPWLVRDTRVGRISLGGIGGEGGGRIAPPFGFVAALVGLVFGALWLRGAWQPDVALPWRVALVGFGLAVLAMGGILGLRDARAIATPQAWMVATPTRLLLGAGRKVDVYRWEGFSPVVLVGARGEHSYVELTWLGRDGAERARLRLWDLPDPEGSAADFRARVAQRVSHDG